MKNKKLIITIGICSIFVLGGCTKAPIDEQIDKDESIVVESLEDLDTLINSDNFSRLLRITGEDVEIVDVKEPEDNMSYVIYKGIDQSGRDKYKEEIKEFGFDDWMLMEGEDEELLIEVSMTEDNQITLVYPKDEDSTSLEIHLLENISEMIETEE